VNRFGNPGLQDAFHDVAGAGDIDVFVYTLIGYPEDEAAGQVKE